MSRQFRVSRMGSAVLAVAAVTVAVTVIAVPAEAAATGVAKVYNSTKVEYRAASGKANSVTVTRSGRVVTIDDKVAVKAGKGCKAVRGDKTKVRCTTSKTPKLGRRLHRRQGRLHQQQVRHRDDRPGRLG